MKNFKMDNIKINSSKAVIHLKGKVFDFRDCSTLKDIKTKIIEEIIPLCRECGLERYCKFYKKEEEPCSLQIKFMNNYLESTIKFIPKNSSVHMKEYIEYLLHILRLLEIFNNWQGGILDKDILKWQGEAILNLDKYWFKKLNLELAYVIDKYFFIQPAEKNFYRYKIFLEGKDDREALKNISEKLNFYFFEERIEALDGEGETKNTIRYIKKLISDGYDIFFLMDNEGSWYNVIKKELINKSLICEKEQIFKFKKALEDSFPWQIQKKAFLELNGIPIPDNLKNQFNEKFFKARSKFKITDRLQKALLPHEINFKRNFKEKFNQNLLKFFLEEGNIQKNRCELVQRIKQIIKAVNDKLRKI